jgi:hypothetical protein
MNKSVEIAIGLPDGRRDNDISLLFVVLVVA